MGRSHAALQKAACGRMASALVALLQGGAQVAEARCRRKVSVSRLTWAGLEHVFIMIPPVNECPTELQSQSSSYNLLACTVVIDIYLLFVSGLAAQFCNYIACHWLPDVRLTTSQRGCSNDCTCWFP